MRQPFFNIGNKIEIDNFVYRISSIRTDSLKTVYELEGVHFCRRRYLDESTFFKSLV